MKWSIDLKIPKFPFEIQHKDPCLFLGSCFSDEISSLFQQAGFSVSANPFGTLFHPEVIAKQLESTLKQDFLYSIHQRDDLYFDWFCSGKIVEYSSEALKNRILKIKTTFLEEIKRSKTIFITFGTSWGYRLNENKMLVANCHKANAALFTKENTDLQSMFKVWDKTLNLLFETNPTINVVFTLSPVRHIRDGVIENNRSKARLLELISLLEQRENCFYFPSYEIVIDELRDYRFYKEDLIHPNEQAVKYIWNKLKTSFFSQQTIQLAQQIEQIHIEEQHQSLNEKSQEFKQFKQRLSEKKTQLKNEFPFLKI
jgi:hypothetical protein